MVTGRAVHFSATELNKLLDGKARQSPVPPDELKRFLRYNVIPILEGTALDRRTPSTPTRRQLGALVRDAAFSATVLRANPHGAFVQKIVDCLLQDHERMQFVRQMTPAQAAKVIVHLSKVGVSNVAVYSILASRLDFSNLRELARVMFALNEAGLYEVTVNVVVPLYSGERWTLTPAAPTSASSTEVDSSDQSASPSAPLTKASRDASNTVFEATRALRALSTSVRSCATQRRRLLGHTARREFSDDPQDEDEAHSVGPSTTLASTIPLPYDSVDQLRNALILFVLSNAEHMRGAHWINFTRALELFPVEAEELHGLAQYRGVQRMLTNAMEAAGCPPASPATGPSPAESGAAFPAITCSQLAEVGLYHVFDYDEGRKPLPYARRHESPPSTSSTPTPYFDASARDLVKLLAMVAVSKTPARQRRVEHVVQALLDGASALFFREFVQVLQSFRQLDASPSVTDAAQRIADQAAARLVAKPVNVVLQYETTPEQLSQFAALLNLLRVPRCDDFVRFLIDASSALPSPLSPEIAVHLLSALSTVGNGAGTDSPSAVQSAALQIVEKVCNLSTSSPLQTHDALPLLSQYPQQSTRMLRALVFLDVVPPVAVLHAFFGSEDDLPITPAVDEAGGVVVFDLTRSLYHFVKQIGPNTADVVEVLWNRGVLHSALPLLLHHSFALARTVRQTDIPSASYVPVAWRSCMETVLQFLEVQQSAAGAATQVVVPWLLQAYKPCTTLLETAAAIAAVQVQHTRESSPAPVQQLQHFNAIHFTANAPLHYLSALLMWEHALFQLDWDLRRHPTPTLPAADSTVDDDSVVTRSTSASSSAPKVVHDLKVDYLAFLNAPLFSTSSTAAYTSSLRHHRGFGLVVPTYSPMDVVRSVFGTPPRGSSEPVKDPLLRKRHALEVTTTLPFAISLVMNPGPVNEYFTEHCVPLILQEETG